MPPDGPSVPGRVLAAQPGTVPGEAARDPRALSVCASTRGAHVPRERLRQEQAEQNPFKLCPPPPPKLHLFKPSSI